MAVGPLRDRLTTHRSAPLGTYRLFARPTAPRVGALDYGTVQNRRSQHDRSTRFVRYAHGQHCNLFFRPFEQGTGSTCGESSQCQSILDNNVADLGSRTSTQMRHRVQKSHNSFSLENIEETEHPSGQLGARNSSKMHRGQGCPARSCYAASATGFL
jgi:hypothetical protein